MLSAANLLGNEIGPPQHLEVLGHGWATQVELCCECASIARRLGEEFEESTTYRVRECAEHVHIGHPAIMSEDSDTSRPLPSPPHPKPHGFAPLALVTPEDVGRTTPCSEWTVADLSDHVVNSIAGMAAMAQGGEPDWAASTHHDDPASALQREGRGLVEALDAGNGSFPEGMAAAELAVHAYALTTALDRTTADLDPEVAEAGLAFMTSSMPDDMRGVAFGPE